MTTPYTDDRPRGAHLFGVIPEGHEVVVFIWSTEYGHCYECGLPAAYVIDDERPRNPSLLRCSTCAAVAASEGSPIVWLFAEPSDE